MSARCTGEPISWLRLERYAAGEVDGDERDRIASHLAACSACAECFASIARDDAVALSPLPVARARVKTGARGWSFGARAAMVAGGLALAASVAVSVGRWGEEPRTDDASLAARVKGDAVAFSLVRDDDEWIVEAGGVFRDGDRFKAVVTCPPSLAATFDVVVYDANGASFPLTPARLACGNGVPMPGAFRLSGRDAETVCLVWEADGDPARGALVAGVASLGERAVCKRLTPK